MKNYSKLYVMYHMTIFVSYLQVYNNRTSTADFIGRIIRLTIRCDYSQAKPLNRQYTRYLFFKYVGSVTCKFYLFSLFNNTGQNQNMYFTNDIAK